MTCLHPIRLETLGITVPCRRCIKCRIAITNEWTTRLVHEARYHEQNCFITLTFRNENLPLCRSLCKRTLQCFIKRLRKKVKVKIKYYAVGEYGDQHEREHYHLVIFGWSPPLEDLYFAYKKKGKNYYASRIISALWTRGFNTVGTVTRDSCQYCAGYVRKKLYGQRADAVYGQRLRPFALQSTSLAAQYADDNKTRIEKHLSIIEGNKDIGLPRYYQRVVGCDPERLIMKRLQKEADCLQNYVDDGYSWTEYQELAKKALEQEEKDLLYQNKLRSMK